MNGVGRVLLGAGIFALVLPALGSTEDLTIVSRVSSPRSGRAGSQTQYISSAKVRTSEGSKDIILDLASGRITQVNNRRREYSETTVDEMRAFMAQLEAAMAGNPLMEKMIGGMAPVRVQKGTGGRMIAGYGTEQYVLTLGDNMRFEIWAAPELQPPVQYFDARKALYAAMGPIGRRFDAVFDEMKKIKGFPLATTMDYKMTMVQQQTLTEATDVRKGPIPDSAFEVPAGYRKVPSPFTKRG